MRSVLAVPPKWCLPSRHEPVPTASTRTHFADTGGLLVQSGATVIDMTAEAPPGGPAGAGGPVGDQAWARPGSPAPPPHTTSVTPTPGPRIHSAWTGPVVMPPQQYGAPGPSGRSPMRVLLVAAAVLSFAAIAMTAIKWATPAPEPVTTTVTAGPPAYTDDEITKAKKESCDASLDINEPVNRVQKALLAAAPGSPERQAALAEYQTVTMVEIEYLKTKTTAAAPQSVRDGVQRAINALLAEVDAMTRGLSVQEQAERADAVKAAGRNLDEVCK